MCYYETINVHIVCLLSVVFTNNMSSIADEPVGPVEDPPVGGLGARPQHGDEWLNGD